MDVGEVVPRPSRDMPVALPRAHRKEQAEAKASDYIVETSPMVVESERDHYKAVQRVTMKKEDKQVGHCVTSVFHAQFGLTRSKCCFSCNFENQYEYVQNAHVRSVKFEPFAP